MKRYLLTLAVGLILVGSLSARIYTIKQDGTGHFTTITAGIDAAQDGDELLVYPGIYDENINYSGKNIVISSLYSRENGDRSYIRNTIIDGGNRDTVVRFISGETRDAVLSGFTIRNGYARVWLASAFAGGILISNDSSPEISYNVIENNFCNTGAGGIYVNGGRPLLKGNTVRHNFGLWTGGISTVRSDTEFCPTRPNSIYYNYGNRGDLYISYTSQQRIVIDTLTVNNHDPYFADYDRLSTSIPRNFHFIIINPKIEPVRADLYVSPDGCDSNSGLTPEEPLQRIATALIRIQPDRNFRRTIHLSEGVYSKSANNQLLPIVPREYIDIVGADKETTIIDGEDRYMLLFSAGSSDHYQLDQQYFRRHFNVRNMTLTRGNDGDNVLPPVFLWFSNDFSLENIIVSNNQAVFYRSDIGYYLLSILQCYNYSIKNIDIINNNIGNTHDPQWAVDLFSATGGDANSTNYIENIRFINNRSPFPPMIRLGYSSHRHSTGRYGMTIVNLEMQNNENHRLMFSGTVRLINATIGENRPNYGTNNSLVSLVNGVLSVYNSIFYNEHNDKQFSLGGTNSVLNISHSLVKEGRNGVIDPYGNNTINWNEGNIDTDPLFTGENDLGLSPYSLSPLSPAIGAGTLDIPSFEFPEYDLAGKPRIVDGSIDMGAYQWHPPTSVEERDEVTKGLREGEFNLRNFPNPITYLHSERKERGTAGSAGTTISFQTPEHGNVMIEIYNLKGQLVKRIFDAYIPQGEYNVFWDGRDERERYVATGFYMYHLKFNEQLVATGRCTFIK